MESTHLVVVGPNKIVTSEISKKKIFLLIKMSKAEVSIKFRYIVHGKPCNRQYTIEEAQWCDISNRFISEQTHTVRSNDLKNWIGYTPSVVGDMKTVMWIHFPPVLHKYIQNKSPLHFWKLTQDAFAPYSLEQLRVWT